MLAPFTKKVNSVSEDSASLPEFDSVGTVRMTALTTLFRRWLKANLGTTWRPTSISARVANWLAARKRIISSSVFRNILILH